MPLPPGVSRQPAAAFQIIRQRRSALDFDGQGGLTASAFYRMLQRVLLAPDVLPWDAIGWPPRIDLLLFVHLVAGLTPGVYAFLRDGRRVEAWRRAMRPEFSWSRPAGGPPGMELYQLLAGDARAAAAQLSLGQAIAGDGAFSLGMIADFEAALREHGPSFYRNLYWEAGLVGQVLYLEAEAAGVRATGIGAYFDDQVHALAGLRNRAFQSVYHFTVGSPVEDPRITTLPA